MLVLIITTSFNSCLPAEESVRFDKQVLTGEYYCDGVAVGDFNLDGHLDVVAGPYWYEGPQWTKQHEIYRPVPIPRAASPSDSMFSFVADFNGDQYPDVLVLGRVHKHPAYWYENPGASSPETADGDPPPWARHYVFERIRGESPAFCDLDGNGTPQLVCHWEGRWGYIEPSPADPTAPWEFTPIGDFRDWPQFYHGTGVGDLNGDGRIDVIINDGWYQQPSELPAGQPSRPWTFHEQRFSPDRGGAQIFADDIDGDGDADVISSLHAHEWGLAWFEQLADGQGFVMHKIMGDRGEQSKYGVAFSQPHALQVADINGDGQTDIVVGKRRWAHGPTGDVEPSAPPVVYWFESTRDARGKPDFKPHLIDAASGVGTQISVCDLNQDGRPDILTASKLGTFVFFSRLVD